MGPKKAKKIMAFHRPSLLDFCIAESDMLNTHELWWNPAVKTDHAAVAVTFPMRRPPRPPPHIRAWRPTSEHRCKTWMWYQDVVWTVGGLLDFAERTQKAFQMPGTRKTRRANRDSLEVKNLIQSRKDSHDDSDYFMLGERIQEARHGAAQAQAGEMEQASWKKGQARLQHQEAEADHGDASASEYSFEVGGTGGPIARSYLTEYSFEVGGGRGPWWCVSAANYLQPAVPVELGG